MMKAAKALVVGGAGFVGSNLVKRLLKDGAKSVHVVDNLLSAERVNIPDDSRVHFSHTSIANDEFLDTLGDEFDYIFHLATYHGNQSSIHDPLADHENNTLTSLKLFHHVQNFKNLKKLVYSGAGCAVAEKTFDQASATTESDIVSLKMDSPYSISKIIGEYYAVYFHGLYKTPIVRVRFQNVYGPGEILGAGDWRGTPATVWRNVTPTFIYKSLATQSLTIENEGIATRDFIYVDDIVEGLICAAANGTPGDVYNLASGKETTIKELAQLVTEKTGNTASPVFLPKRVWDHSGKRFGSTDKAEKEIGFRAKVGIEEGLDRAIAWTKENLSLIKQTMKKHESHFPMD